MAEYIVLDSDIVCTTKLELQQQVLLVSKLSDRGSNFSVAKMNVLNQSCCFLLPTVDRSMHHHQLITNIKPRYDSVSTYHGKVSTIIRRVVLSFSHLPLSLITFEMLTLHDVFLASWAIFRCSKIRSQSNSADCIFTLKIWESYLVNPYTLYAVFKNRMIYSNDKRMPNDKGKIHLWIVCYHLSLYINKAVIKNISFHYQFVMLLLMHPKVWITLYLKFYLKAFTTCEI